MAGNACDALDIEDALGGYAAPLPYGLRRDADRTSNGAGAPCGSESAFKGVGGRFDVHAAILKHTFSMNTSYALLDGSFFSFDERRMKATLGSALRNARKAKRLTLQEVGAHIGVSAQAVGQWERDSDAPSTGNLRAYCELLAISLDAASRGETVFLDDASAADASEVMQITSPEIPAFGPMDLEVRGTTMGGEDGDDDAFQFNGAVTQHVRRPPGLAKLKNVFGLYVFGTSMVPRYEPHELVFCGGREPIAGDYVVVELVPHDHRPGPSYIKRLVKRGGGKIVLEQFNPPKTLTLSATDVLRIHRVIPNMELMGF